MTIKKLTEIETSVRNATLTSQLAGWSRLVGRGVVTDSSAIFVLPDSSRLAASAAWLSRGRLRARPACPEFVVELLSPADQRHEKMLSWIANGAELGWMIDPIQQTVSIYRPNGEVEVRGDRR